MTRSIFPVVCSPDLDAARDFYCGLVGLEVVFEGGWYTALAAPGNAEAQAQVAFVAIGHPSVPPAWSRPAAGVLVTVDVGAPAAVDEVAERAVAGGVEIVQSLRDEDFGQRHVMLADPNGLIADIVAFIPPSRAFLRQVAAWRRSRHG